MGPMQPQQNVGNKNSLISLVAIIVLSVLLLGVSGFAIWSFMGRSDYKNNVDSKIATAVSRNTKKVQSEDAKNYAIEAQKPLKIYTGPDTYGSVTFSYPKTWSVYTAKGTSSVPLDFYAYPEIVSGDSATSYALRMQVNAQSYANSVKSLAAAEKKGDITVTPYALAQNPDVTGVRIAGKISQDKTGSMVILPLRDKTLKIWTESDTYISQFNEFVLANAHFTP